MKTTISTTIVGTVMFVLLFNIVGQSTMNLAWAEDDNYTGNNLGNGINTTSNSIENSALPDFNGTMQPNNNDKDKPWDDYQLALYHVEHDYRMAVDSATLSYYQAIHAANTNKQQTDAGAGLAFHNVLRSAYQAYETAEDNANGDKNLIAAAQIARDTAIGNAENCIGYSNRPVRCCTETELIFRLK